MNSNNQAQESASFNPMRLIGGLLSDTVEAVKFVGNEIIDAPQALADGWKDGGIIDTDDFKAKKAQPTTSEAIIVPATIVDEETELETLRRENAELKAAQQKDLAEQA